MNPIAWWMDYWAGLMDCCTAHLIGTKASSGDKKTVVVPADAPRTRR